uniref:Uncharacterized protein n=1 Tax=Photinus pyralis TaxID=7054 RepID=A0A1Y1L366_PHOPY
MHITKLTIIIPLVDRDERNLKMKNPGNHGESVDANPKSVCNQIEVIRTILRPNLSAAGPKIGIPRSMASMTHIWRISTKKLLSHTRSHSDIIDEDISVRLYS